MTTYTLANMMTAFSLNMAQAHTDGPIFCQFEHADDHPSGEKHDEMEIVLVVKDGFIGVGSCFDRKEWQISTCDDEGCCMIKVPFYAVTRILTHDEYESLCMMREADARLLSYAY